MKEIDEAVKIQNQKQEQLAKKATVIVLIILNAKDANIYVYDKDKIIILAYKPLVMMMKCIIMHMILVINVYHISKVLIRDDIISNMMRIIMKKI